MLISVWCFFTFLPAVGVSTFKNVTQVNNPRKPFTPLYPAQKIKSKHVEKTLQVAASMVLTL